MNTVKNFFVALCLCCLASVTVDAQNIKLMSFNVRMGIADDGENNWELRKEAAAKMLAMEAPDCFGVQEAYDFQRDYFLEKMPSYKAVGKGRNDGSDSGEHMCIFYDTDKLTLVRNDDFWLSETPDVPSKGWDAKYPRIATWVLLQHNKSGKRFFVVNTHLDHKGVLARKNSVILIKDKIESMNPDSLPMVLMGDFNLEENDDAIIYFNSLMNNARLTARSTDHKDSFNAWGNTDDGKIIDYIYYTGFSKCVKFKTITGKWMGRNLLSDHNPIVAGFVF